MSCQECFPWIATCLTCWDSKHSRVISRNRPLGQMSIFRILTKITRYLLFYHFISEGFIFSLFLITWTHPIYHFLCTLTLFWYYLINRKAASTTDYKYLTNQHFHKCNSDIWLPQWPFPSLFIADYIFTCNADIIPLFVLQEVPATAH